MLSVPKYHYIPRKDCFDRMTQDKNLPKSTAQINGTMATTAHLQITKLTQCETQDKAALAELCYIIVADFTLCNRFGLGEQNDNNLHDNCQLALHMDDIRDVGLKPHDNEATGSLAWFVVAYTNSMIYKSTDSLDNSYS